MNLSDLDAVIHAPKRLAAMSVLAGGEHADFGFLRDHLGISDSDLSKQMNTLEHAGYVKVKKTGRGRGGATWYRITPAGRQAYRRHIAALNAIVADPARHSWRNEDEGR
ncbi:MULTISPECIES: transcriptional regulator [Saccharopolyspora]|uniref:HTH arsR-type domain-containing protein n=1 Tax=Saccharopolyspora gregorii TaxID=33914 RepID=A0ABP6RW93_9PSEU|nr:MULTISPECIES: transcriptional regulator [Saccharopolyspora]MCA1190200.1 transcriptional regulator [Saccharopolyspora sp. 6T]MCA1192612.1 transcriptional regulator [Saccharopolyspora sp. 6V]MCA1226655.1 transcriptional regulator [Saccharopolyspora sp. 6M]MCA1278950.1 transcriptional regulator [Saccharopolyspora sp. 7B]